MVFGASAKRAPGMSEARDEADPGRRRRAVDRAKAWQSGTERTQLQRRIEETGDKPSVRPGT